MREPTLRAVSDRVARQEINDLMYNISWDERDSEVQDCADFTFTTTVHSNHIPGVNLVSPFTMNQRQWDLLGQFERSAFLFIKLGGHGTEGQHVPRRVDYLRMSPEVMKEKLQSFENIHLFPLLNKRLHNSGGHVDTFLNCLQENTGLDIGDCLEKFRSALQKTRYIDAECTESTISVKCALRQTEHCKFHWFLIFKQWSTEISGSLTKTGIKWDEDGDRDPTHDITYSVKRDPGLQKMKDCALQFQPLGGTTEHWLCPCALWVSTVIGKYNQKGYIPGMSSSGISVEHLHLKLVYSSVEM
ncbi:hypothetical protein BDV26DRAFT_292882 [Aspergillus bertholletiae]|uniref:Uncharacterized protein n=1 Tax=Aspergillus bertholletiae TaxID=1226010 RepID=A0A5N7B7P3_9EURO|nr:hypothetical protein BDV26DRAFT_292882 [Aspergillus bertholletiae]